LDTALEPGGRAAARIPDTSLADGTYELRALVRDAAGNETLADRDAVGRPMTVVLPLRLTTRIAARTSTPRRCRTVRRRLGRRTLSRRECSPAARLPVTAAPPVPLRVPFGRPATLSGVLETWQGRPVSGAQVAVLERVRTQHLWRRVGAARSDAAGRLSHRIAPGPSRTVRFDYDGNAVLLPSWREARVLVAAGGTIGVSARRSRNGGRVLFRGRILGRPFPTGGRTVDLQAFYRGAWRTFATPRIDARGRWSQRYRFGATRGRVAYRFRAVLKRDGGYPYEHGVTRTVKVTVTG
jgi:hypothetical protein